MFNSIYTLHSDGDKSGPREPLVILRPCPYSLISSTVTLSLKKSLGRIQSSGRYVKWATHITISDDNSQPLNPNPIAKFCRPVVCRLPRAHETCWCVVTVQRWVHLRWSRWDRWRSDACHISPTFYAEEDTLRNFVPDVIEGFVLEPWLLAAIN